MCSGITLVVHPCTGLLWGCMLATRHWPGPHRLSGGLALLGRSFLQRRCAYGDPATCGGRVLAAAYSATFALVGLALGLVLPRWAPAAVDFIMATVLLNFLH